MGPVLLQSQHALCPRILALALLYHLIGQSHVEGVDSKTVWLRNPSYH